MVAYKYGGTEVTWVIFLISLLCLEIEIIMSWKRILSRLNDLLCRENEKYYLEKTKSYVEKTKKKSRVNDIILFKRLTM